MLTAIALTGSCLFIVSKISTNQRYLLINQTDKSSTTKEITKKKGDHVVAQLPNCTSDSLYTVPPIPLNKIEHILPLGNINPGGHVTPTDHLYFVITRPNISGNDVHSEVVDLFAPGDMTIYSVGRQTQAQNGTVINTDYFIRFSPCREVTGLFGHVSSFFGSLANIDFPQCNPPYSTGGQETYQQCTADVNLKVKAGEKIGAAGGKLSAALDVNTYDERLPDPYITNPNHFYNTKATCAINYFGPELQGKLRDLLGGHGPNKRGVARRTTEPVCGEIWQDKKGTLQGNWFYGTSEQADQDSKRQMSLVHDNVDPSMAAFTVGGTIVEQGISWNFAPAHSGLINREFSEVIVGDTIYCYQPLENTDRRFLTQLFGETKLKIEAQSGSCTTGVNFKNPIIYER